MVYIKYIKNIYFIYTNRCFLAVFIYTVYIKYIQKEGGYPTFINKVIYGN